MNTDIRARFQTALDTAQTQVASAADEVEGIGPSLLGKALTDIEVDDTAEAADRAVEFLREAQDALESMAALLRSAEDV